MQDDIVCVLPERAHDLERLHELVKGANPTIAVIGKYNHGKSRLLNELVGQDVFAVSDKRETVNLLEYLHRGVRWLDAPGLDADVGNDDDRHALRAAWLKSDIRLFVHTAKEGELDSKELALLEELRSDVRRTRRQTIVVVSQVDQLADEDELANVLSAITEQVRGVSLQAVSATRHRQGVEAAKKRLIEKSGIPPLKELLEDALALVPQARKHETELLLLEIRRDLDQRLTNQVRMLESLRQKQGRQRQMFDEKLQSILDKTARDIEEVVDAPIQDYAVVPDTRQDKYRLTQAKLERARIQIAYSRACIGIDSFLAGQGVIGLPKAQQTAAGSLNTVMVAVMGLSVKFRKDLRTRFCEKSGRERLQREFAKYYELSKDRATLRAEVMDIEWALAATRCAWAALRVLERNT